MTTELRDAGVDGRGFRACGRRECAGREGRAHGLIRGRAASGVVGAFVRNIQTSGTARLREEVGAVIEARECDFRVSFEEGEIDAQSALASPPDHHDA